MGNYDAIQIPVGAQPISSGQFGVRVRDAILDLDRRVSSLDPNTGTGKAYSASNLILTTTTETAALTITGMTFIAGLAYQASIRNGMSTAADGTLCNFRVRKYNATPASGADWGEFYRVRGTTSVMLVNGDLILINNTSADVTSDVNLTVTSSVAAANAVNVFATASSPRYFIIKPIGFASDYAGMGVQVT
jgi:hypothetical protein